MTHSNQIAARAGIGLYELKSLKGMSFAPVLASGGSVFQATTA